ncbi:unnamed protein product [Albugo candida]|nr:unnamed protein product [Albugo candida]|eukprot:CCI41837.1 unnamed protein product [Albugo candida]
MELAGLSVACAIEKEFPTSRAVRKSDLNVLALAGKGNNGGDALVAARYLKMFGYSPSIYHPILSDNEHIRNLISQCSAWGIPMLKELPQPGTIDQEFGFILDGIFGFGFKGEIRHPFNQIIDQIKRCQSTRIISIDIPSGWEVDTGELTFSFRLIHRQSIGVGNINGQGLDPYMLISMSVPKLCAKFHEEKPDTVHYLGGRFIPEYEFSPLSTSTAQLSFVRELNELWSLSLPPFSGSEVCVKLKPIDSHVI